MRKEPQAPPQKVYRREIFQLVQTERLEESEERTLLGAVTVTTTVGRGLSWGRSVGGDAGGARGSWGLAGWGGRREDKGGKARGGRVAGGNGAAA